MHPNRLCYKRCKLNESECNALYKIELERLSKCTHVCTRGTFACDGTLDVNDCRIYQYNAKRLLSQRDRFNSFNNRKMLTIRSNIGRYVKDNEFIKYRNLMNTQFLRQCLLKLNLSNVFNTVFVKEFIVKPYDRRLKFVKSFFKLEWFINVRRCNQHWYKYYEPLIHDSIIPYLDR